MGGGNGGPSFSKSHGCPEEVTYCDNDLTMLA
jgi:hypothetical protein